MATGSPVSFWYGTRAQFDSITTKLDTTLYFITDEQALYKGTVKFSGSGVDTLLTISATEPTASSVTTGDKYFNTTDNLIHVLKNENGTVTTTATYEPANGALYYNADAQRFQTLIKDGSSYIPTEIYDAGISVEDGTGLVLNGTTVSGLNATTNSKGVVQVGDNLNVSDGVVSVPTATNARFGVVKSGDNITNNNGVISVAKATASALGVVKVGSNINVDNNGQISVPVANGNTKGVTKVGTNIDVADGVISVKDASTSDKGVVQLVNNPDSSDMSSETRAITPHAVGQIATTINDAINTKQANLSNGNVTTLNTTSGAKIDVNFGDGLDVGVTGTTNANKLIVNEASVKEVLEDVVDGGTEPAVNEIVTADNLRGALSVGQVVDVSCQAVPPTWQSNYMNQISIDGGTTWVASSTADYAKVGLQLGTFRIRRTGNPAAMAAFAFGWQSNDFPKYATGLKYLFILDCKNLSSSSTKVNAFTSNAALIGPVYDIPSNGYARVAFVVTTARGLFTFQNVSAVSSFDVEIKNWRQYEVTALTDEAIAYIAQLPDPDAFFRSTSAYSIRDKYLIKQDMVCPFIPTINMPDNSAGLTVGAGLSYKIKYTKTGTYSVSVDTIPTDAYGWDAHIQMFVKDTAIVQFQTPLILMDALTPNAGHNLSVKFRNGNALVYVDDTNAGTMVYLATGTTTTVGSLPYALSQTPPSEDATFTNFVVFSPVLGGTVCSMGTMSNVAYSVSLIGNGDDSTIIGGTIGLASGKYLAVQDINLNDIEITSGTLNIGNNVKVTGTTTNGVVGSGTGVIVLDENCLLEFSDQANNIPITGASISAVSGARAIPYGETESEAIGAGTGNAVNKYGKCGYLVSVASGTASNTLYDALVGGGTPYSNICFDPALDGQTVSIPENTNVAQRPVSIYGNGIDNTIISGSKFNIYALGGVGGVQTLADCAIKGSTCQLGVYKVSNILVDSVTTPADKANGFMYLNGAGTITGSTFTHCRATADNKPLALFALNATNKIYVTDCLFVDNTSTNYWGIISTYGKGTAYLTNCTLSNNMGGSASVGVKVCANAEGASTLEVSGCTITSTKIQIDSHATNGPATLRFSGTNILNSTVSGAGSVVFADGATVTSMIPSGSTIGTGVISAQMSSLVQGAHAALENVTVTGVTSGITIPCLIEVNTTTAEFDIVNCLITGNFGTSSGWQYPIAMRSGTMRITGSTISGNHGNDTVYCNAGKLYWTNSRAKYLSIWSGGRVIIDGTNNVFDNSIMNNPTASGDMFIFTPGSVVSVYAIVSSQYGMFYVGTYDAATDTVTTTGTATVVLNGTTVSISGSGTTIDSTGLHS